MVKKASKRAQKKVTKRTPKKTENEVVRKRKTPVKSKGFDYFNEMSNLATPRKDGVHKGRHPGLPDNVTERLDQCSSASSMASFAHQIGICEQELKDMASSSINFGMFRMRIGNRVRTILKRITKAESDGKKITKEQAAYPPNGKYTTKWVKK